MSDWVVLFCVSNIIFDRNEVSEKVRTGTGSKITWPNIKNSLCLMWKHKTQVGSENPGPIFTEGVQLKLS